MLVEFNPYQKDSKGPSHFPGKTSYLPMDASDDRFPITVRRNKSPEIVSAIEDFR